MRNTGSVPFVDGKSEIPCFMDVFLVYYLYTFFCFPFSGMLSYLQLKEIQHCVVFLYLHIFVDALKDEG